MKRFFRKRKITSCTDLYLYRVGYRKPTILKVCNSCIWWHRKVIYAQGSVLSPVLFSVYIDDIGQLQNNLAGTFVVLYADDILLLAPSVTALQKLLRACEQGLDSIDMSINVKKSCCIRIGVRHDKPCSKITTTDGREFVWADEIRYQYWAYLLCVLLNSNVLWIRLSGVFIVQPIVYLPELGASEEVMVQLLKHKCLPILLYALEVCNLDKRTLLSLDFTVNSGIFHEVVQDIEYRNSTLLSKCVWLWAAHCAIGNKIWQIHW